MKRYTRISIILLIFILAIVTIIFVFPVNGEEEANHTDIKSEDGQAEKIPITDEQLYMNIEAFGKLYGYIRYFHPSDEVESLTSHQWNQFVVYGVSQVKYAEDEEQLKEVLKQLFTPIAPTMVLYIEGEKHDEPIEVSSGTVVAWQHYGLGSSDEYTQSIYKSQRTEASIVNGEFKLVENHLFEEFPKPTESIEKQISPKLFTDIPLVLNKDETGTLGGSGESKSNFESLKRKISNMDLSPENEDVRFAGVIVSWNVLNHFYPYFHVTKSNWSEQLQVALVDVKDDQSEDEYLQSIMHLLEKTKDGHAFTTNKAFVNSKVELPFIVDKVEGKIVVTDADVETELQPGDIILMINGEDSLEVVKQLEEVIPGSSQLKTSISNQMIRQQEAVSLTVQREDNILEITVNGNEKAASSLDIFNRNENVSEIENGIYYVNLTKDIQLEENLETLRNAKGIIFDLRGYPYSEAYMEEIVGRLTNEPVEVPIARIMQTIYPDQQNATFDEVTYAIEPKNTMFKGEVVFLSYGGSISHPEFFLGTIKDNKLATIVGQPTAGSDGNIQRYLIPGRLVGVFTGMEILNRDRTQTHIVGIQPDILVERTINGVKNGEDEYITKALEVIKGE